MKLVPAALAATALSVASSTPAAASEIFGGVYVHDVDTVFTLSGVEDGLDLQLGWRGDSILRIGPAALQPYIFGALNTSGDTNYGAVGLSAKFGDRLYVRPGIGIAVHDGSAANFEDPDDGKVDFGSHVLFEPELSIGTRINSRMTLEASWVHLSQGQLFGKQNPGMDNIGARLSVQLP